MRNQLGLWWGPDIHDILFDIVCLIFGWFFIPLDDIYEFVLYLLLSYPCFPWRCWCPLTRYALPPPPPNSKITWMCMLSWAISMFDAILDCPDACLIIFDRMHIVCHISLLTFMFHDSAWEAVQVRTLTLFYDKTFLLDILFFFKKKTLAYLVILN